MEELRVFALASQRLDWLSVRQAAVASNIANSDTPGYRARDVRPFSTYLEASNLGVTKTDVRHLSETDSGRFEAIAATSAERDVKHSGNTVSLGQELARAGEIRGAHSLTVGVIRAFHQMYLSALRS